MAPELCESILVLAAGGWMARLALRQDPAPRALLFASVYLIVPGLVLGAQALGFDAQATPAKWGAVVINAVLLASLVASTLRADNTTVAALVEAECRAQDAERLAREAQAEVRRIALRGRAELLAAELRAISSVT